MDRNDGIGLPDESGQAADMGPSADTEQDDDSTYIYYTPPFEEPPDDLELCNLLDGLDPPDDLGQPDDTGQASNTGQTSNTGQSAGVTENEIFETVVDDAIDLLNPTDTPEKIAEQVTLMMERVMLTINKCGYPF